MNKVITSIIILICSFIVPMVSIADGGDSGSEPLKPIVLTPPGQKDRPKMPAKDTSSSVICGEYADGILIIEIPESIDGICDLEVNGNTYHHFAVSVSELRAGVYVGSDVSEIVLTLPNGRVYTANI